MVGLLCDAGAILRHPGGECGEDICADAECRIVGISKVEVELGAFHHISYGDSEIGAPFVRTAVFLPPEWKVPGHMGGESAPYDGQGDCLYVQEIPLRLLLGRIGGDLGADLPQPAAPREASDGGAVDNGAVGGRGITAR